MGSGQGVAEGDNTGLIAADVSLFLPTGGGNDSLVSLGPEIPKACPDAFREKKQN